MSKTAFSSPNHGERRLGPPDMIIIHYTGMETCAAARARLCDPANYLGLAPVMVDRVLGDR